MVPFNPGQLQAGDCDSPFADEATDVTIQGRL